MSDEITSATGEGEYVVQPGDSLGSIAAGHGHFWQTLWDLPENAALRELRKHPHILLPGDRLTIPPLRMVARPCVTGAVHRFKRRGIPARIRFTLRTTDGTPLKGKKYELVVADAKYEGVTDDDGSLVQFVDTAARTGNLTFWIAEEGYPETVTKKIRVGELSPVETLAGARARLQGLGYLCADESTFRDSLLAFQRKHELPENTHLDAATAGKLREEYGS